MSIFPPKNQSKKHSVEQKNSRKGIQEFLETTDNFCKTTTGTIASFTLLLGAISSLFLALEPQIPFPRGLVNQDKPVVSTNNNKDNCSNESLSTKHFKQQPLKTSFHTIKTKYGSANMEISVYKNGDIVTIYGTNRKWLCFPESGDKTVADSLIDFIIPQAVAQTTVPNVRERTTYIQKQILSPNNSEIIEQTRIYSDGTVEKMLINRITGTILDKETSTTTITPELQEQLDRGVEVEETTTIDVR